MSLKTDPNLENPDAFYADLLAAHNGLSDADSHALNAQLVLILANHIGDGDTLRVALTLAREGFS
jgi:hypothetical protein